jgi:hypothetical protein
MYEEEFETKIRETFTDVAGRVTEECDAVLGTVSDEIARLDITQERRRHFSILREVFGLMIETNLATLRSGTTLPIA